MIIIGWKSIAVYLQCSVKTAKEYHVKHQMPVLRFPSSKPAIDPDQIREWLRLINHDKSIHQ